MRPKIYKVDGEHFVERKVYPLKDAESGEWILRNFFRFDSVFTMIVIVGVLIMTYGYSLDTKACRDFQEDPCSFFNYTMYESVCIANVPNTNLPDLAMENNWVEETVGE